MNEREFILRIGEDLLRHCPDRYQVPVRKHEGRDTFRLDVEGYVTDCLKLQRRELRLSSDGSILGAAVFRPLTPVTVYENGSSRQIFPSSDVVITDPALQTRGMRGSECGRYRFTLLQMAMYQVLGKAGLITPKDMMVRHATGPDSGEERLAASLAATLLMPDSVLLAMTRSRDYAPFVFYEDRIPPETEREIQRIAWDLQVSERALRRRLRETGLLESRSRWEYPESSRYNI